MRDQDYVGLTPICCPPPSDSRCSRCSLVTCQSSVKHISTSQGDSKTDSFLCLVGSDIATATLAHALAVPPVFSTVNSLFHHSAMNFSISTLTGVEVARLDIDATVTLVELLALLPNEFDDIECSRGIFFGETELKGYMNLSDIGVKEYSVLTVVFGPILRLLTASGDNTAKVWSAGSGECLLTLEGHTGSVYSAVCSADGQQVLTA